MQTYTASSELQRAAEQNANNQQRKRDWSEKYTALHGHPPVTKLYANRGIKRLHLNVHA